MLSAMDNEGGGGGGSPTQPPSPPNIQTETLTCEICIEPYILSENQIKFINPNKCDHPFCSDCVIKYIQAMLDDNIAKIRCPALNCDQFLDPLAYRALVGPQTFIRWCDVLCESALMNLEKSYCPNNNCLALIIDECGGSGLGRKPLTKTNCPNCKQLFCFKCMKLWHAGFSCNEADGFMNDPNDRAFGVLAEIRQWQRCPGCRRYVERIFGCPSILCRCGVRFCYKCGAKFNESGNCECEIERCRYLCIYIVLIIGCLVLVILPVILRRRRNK